MKSKIILCLALVLSGNLILSRADETNTITSTNLSVAKIVNPQGTVDLPKLGHAIFREQSSSFTLQVPIESRKSGEPMSNSTNLDLQVWLLKTDGTSIPQSESPTVISVWSFGDYSTDYMFYHFPKVLLNELTGVVISMNGKLYCHEIEKDSGEPSSPQDEGDIFQISPTNIASSPVSVQVTNWDSSEWFTIFYKADKASDKFIDARLEISDAGSIISSTPAPKTWTTNGFRFHFNTGYVWPFRFKIIETAHDGEKPMPGFYGYWFYLRDFATNVSTSNIEKIVHSFDAKSCGIIIPELNAPVDFTEQPTQYTVQLSVGGFRDDEKYTVPKADELHRQVWLLRPDGTSIPQWHKPIVIGNGNGGFMNFYLVSTFQRKATDEVAGMVVSINGKLFCRKLPDDWNKP
jgi:hypothetical protein